jgi:hypothetical protein
MGGGADWKEGLQDLVDQVLGLTSVQWGYAVIAAAAVFLWIWVMGAPKGRRPGVVAGAAAVIVGAGVSLALALFAPHHLA